MPALNSRGTGERFRSEAGHRSTSTLESHNSAMARVRGAYLVERVAAGAHVAHIVLEGQLARPGACPSPSALAAGRTTRPFTLPAHPARMRIAITAACLHAHAFSS